MSKRIVNLLFVLLAIFQAITTQYYDDFSNNQYDQNEEQNSIFDNNNRDNTQNGWSGIAGNRNFENRDTLTEKKKSKIIEKKFENVTVKVGRKAILPCFVNDLGSHKVIWAKNGDILSLGTTKINSDIRLQIQHRYVSEWHLVIENVATDDEGPYICKTNGNFYKIINLQVLMPPTIDDANSIPAGTINLKEKSSLTLKCHAEGNPEPKVKWYRWKKNKQSESNKEELRFVGNELNIENLKRTDPNTYECIAKNSVPPATSRIFNIEIHFLPVIELKQGLRSHHSVSAKKFSLECQISANPLEQIHWYRNGQIISDQYRYVTPLQKDNFQIISVDISNINEFYKTLVTLTVINPKRSDFGEYQCCAMNAYGQTCSNLRVREKNELVIPKRRVTYESIKIRTTTSEPLEQKSLEKNYWNQNYINDKKDNRIDVLYTNSRVFSEIESKTTTRNPLMLSQDAKRRQNFIKTSFHLGSSAQSIFQNFHISIIFSLFLFIKILNCVIY